jgi:hypothetical protein
MQFGSMFISNCYNTLHVSQAIFIHPQEHLKTLQHVSIIIQIIFTELDAPC